MSLARGLFFWLLAIVAFFGVGVACGDDPPATVLQTIDLSLPDGGPPTPFDRNNIVDQAAFTDFETLDRAAVQKFLSKSPYQRASFLETYQSNGLRAADAIVAAARQYKINPLVFLVFAETTQGLVGSRDYVFPPDRVEYIFNCGCLAVGKCAPELAGFDRQVACLGKILRQSLDEAKLGKTASGWGQDITSDTLDGQKVTPANAATAALYSRLPRVDENKEGGLWVFWNVWNLYATKIEYVGPIGLVDGKWIGDACTQSAECAGVEGARCADTFPDGMCFLPCTGACPSQPDKPPVFCAKFKEGSFCVRHCNRAAGAESCRAGYECIHVAGTAAGEADDICYPASE